MTALYRAGRQSDALDAYRHARLTLIERSGVEPSPRSPRSTADPRPGHRSADPAVITGDPADQLESRWWPRRRAARRWRPAGQPGTVRDGLRPGGAGRRPHRHGPGRPGAGGLWVHEHRTATSKTQLHARLTRALAAVDPGSPEALRLRVRLAGENDYRTAKHADILALLDDARLAEDPAVHTEALSIAHHCVLGPDHAA